MRSSPLPASHTRAFTLTELVMVMAVTSLLAFGSVGMLLGLGAWREAAGARRLQGDLEYTRRLALLSTCRAAWVLSGPANTSYTIEQEASPTTGAFAGSAVADPLTGEAWQVSFPDVAAGLSVSQLVGVSNGTIVFDGNGAPGTTAGVAWTEDGVLTLSSGVVITVRATSGRVEVQW